MSRHISVKILSLLLIAKNESYDREGDWRGGNLRRKSIRKTDCELFELTNHFLHPSTIRKYVISKDGRAVGLKKIAEWKWWRRRNGGKKNDFQYINDDIRSCIKFLGVIFYGGKVRSKDISDLDFFSLFLLFYRYRQKWNRKSKLMRCINAFWNRRSNKFSYFFAPTTLRASFPFLLLPFHFSTLFWSINATKYNIALTSWKF